MSVHPSAGMRRSGHARASTWPKVAAMAALNGICLCAVARVRLPDVPDMVRRGEITDAEPLAALLDALLELGRVGRPPRG